MATNLANQLSKLRPDQLATITFEAGFDANLNFSTASYDNFVATNFNTNNPTLPAQTATETTIQTGLQAGGTITFSFYSQGASYGFSQAEIDNAIQALTLWSGMANINFTYQPLPINAAIWFVHAGDTIGSNITPVAPGTYFKLNGSVATVTANLARTTNGIISLDASKYPNGSFKYGDFTSLITQAGYGFDSLVHEVGHLVGLGHTGPYNFSTVPALNVPSIPNQNNASDVRDWSIMSYIDPNASGAGNVPAFASSYNPVVNWGTDGSGTLRSPFTPMGLDIIAAQRLLGAPTNGLFSGGQVFGFNSNLTFTDNNGVSKKLAPYDFGLDPVPVVTLFDTGSNNTLDLSGFNTASTVDLRDGQWSSVAGLTDNIFIEWGTRIDSVIGGGGNNVFTANLDSDSFEGGSGGNNQVIFADKRANYAYSTANGTITLTDTVAGHASVNRLHNIQSVTFSDATVAASVLSTFLWTGAVSTDFGIAGNWNNLAVPTTGADVSINGTSGTFVQVVQQQTNTLNSLLVGAGNTLDITVGQFGFSGSTRASNIVGLFEVDTGATVYFGGNLGNYGTIFVGGRFLVDTANVAISGGGTLRLAGGNIGSFEDANGSPLQYDVFQNTDNTITGNGVIGSSGFSFPIRFFNAGTVLANDPQALTVKGATTNTGVLSDAATGGTLDLSGSIDNSGGVIQSNGTVGSVVLDGVTIRGGQLLASAGGGYVTSGNVTLDSTGAPITLNANLTLAAGSGLTVIGALVGSGTLIGAGGGLFMSGRKVIKVATQGTPTGKIISTGSVYLGAVPPPVLPTAITIGPDLSATFTQGAVANGFTANFSNTGTIALTGTTGGGALMLIDSGALSTTPIAFSGHGTIQLGNPDDTIMGLHSFAGTDKLENIDNVITGQGEIGAGNLDVSNDAAGTISAAGGTLTLDPKASDTLTNAGWIGAAATGTLLLQSDFSNSGTVGAVAGGTVALTGSIFNTGSIGAAAGATILLAGPVRNQGTIGGLGNVVLIGTLTGGGAGDTGLGGTLTLGGSFGATTGTGVLVSETINAGALVQGSSTGGVLTNVRNSGVVAIGADQTITVTGGLTNNGTIALHGSLNTAATIDHPASLLIQGSVTLNGTGTISLSDAGDRLAGTGTLENTGNTISGRGSIDGTNLLLFNHAGGTILGNAAGLTLNGASGNVLNYGKLKAGAGGTLDLAGTITNGTAIIFTPVFSLGGVGTLVASGSGALLRLGNMTLQNGVITNDTAGEVHITGSTTLSSSSNYSGSFGGIIGNGASIAVKNAANLIIDAGKTLTLLNGLGNGGTISVSNGAILTGGGQLVAAGTVTLAGSARIAASGTLLQNLDNLIHGAGTIDGGTGGVSNEGGTILADGGTLVVSAAATPFLNQSGGVLEASGGVLHFNGDLNNSNVMIAANGTIEVVGTLNGSGQVTLQAGGRVRLGSTVFASEQITFAGTGATLDIADAAHMTGPVNGLQLGDTIHLSAIAADSAVWNGSTLIASQAGTVVAQVGLFGSYSGLTFNAVTDGGSGTNISIACFLGGTLIRTATGERPVETLMVGEMICSAFGGTAPVIWHGKRRIDCSRHPRPHDVWPIRVSAHAFGQGKPQRDLLLSPDHAVHVRDVLIPIRYLVNGATIRQERRDIVTYHHIELPAHDVLFAEGLPAETYLDTGNRGAFAGQQATMLHADFARSVWDAEGCAPLHVSGPLVRAVAGRLFDRAHALGYMVSDDPDIAVVGNGRALPFERRGAHIRVKLPKGCRRVHLRSRQFVPAQMDPDSDDHRLLGVALAPGDLDLGEGWYPAEPDLRWTSGDATIAAPDASDLHFTLAATGRYWVAPAEQATFRPAPRSHPADRA